MGRVKSQARNVAKFGLKMKRKSMEKIFKKKKTPGDEAMSVDAEVVKAALPDLLKDLDAKKRAEKEIAPQETSMEATTLDENGQEVKEKQKPLVREGKLRRTELPFKEQSKKKGAERTDKVKPKKAKGSVVAVRQVSKKKARKLLRDTNRERRKQEREANSMHD